MVVRRILACIVVGCSVCGSAVALYASAIDPAVPTVEPEASMPASADGASLASVLLEFSRLKKATMAQPRVDHQDTAPRIASPSAP